MKTLRTISILFLILIIFTVSSCAPTFSKEAMEHVERDIAFTELQRDPERYQGKWVLLSGVIITTRNTKEGSFIEVLQKPADRQGRPRETDDTHGRFLISSQEFLDAAVYGTGKRISVVGEVAGHKLQQIGEMEYRYPIIIARELRLWEPGTAPRFSFGVGIGVYHRM